jgi:hypothetical protein
MRLIVLLLFVLGSVVAKVGMKPPRALDSGIADAIVDVLLSVNGWNCSMEPSAWCELMLSMEPFDTSNVATARLIVTFATQLDTFPRANVCTLFARAATDALLQMRDSFGQHYGSPWDAASPLALDALYQQSCKRLAPPPLGKNERGELRIAAGLYVVLPASMPDAFWQERVRRSTDYY